MSAIVGNTVLSAEVERGRWSGSKGPEAAAIAEASRTALVDRSHPSSELFRPRFVSNDHRRGRKISAVIEAELNHCVSFDFSVAFVTESGLAPLLQTLRELEAKGIPGRVLTTDYLAFSEPRALRRLAKLSNIEVRMFVTEGQAHHQGFHTKGYLFHYENGTSKVLVGSANLTGSALAVNHEWNLHFTSLENGELFQEIQGEFENLWQKSLPIDDYLDAYRQIYEDKKRIVAQQTIVPYQQVALEPNSMQVQFIGNLLRSMEEGERRALLISATGTGKTYASAFAVRACKAPRMLFLAHREQVLKQSIESYRRVMGSTVTYGLLSGTAKETKADYLFATMQTMAKDSVLGEFDPDWFDVIVIDEVHRAGSSSYQKIMGHFSPRLFLGMTASPDRPDGFDIYKLFDNNIVHEIRLKQALEESLLCPFHYFGITDIEVDDRALDDVGTFSRLVCDERVGHIIEQVRYFGYSGARVKGLMFCRTNKEACELSHKLNERGFRTVALSGADSQQTRERAIDRLTANEGDALYSDRLDYVLTVDIFNEGVDIPDVNQVILLRPTESPIVFVQQLGRGLRKSQDKEFVVVLDFIGNYANNYMIPLALSGDRSYNKDGIRKFVMEGDRTIPGASSVHFDAVSRQRVFESIDAAGVTMKLLQENYRTLRHKLGRIPRMVDFLDHGEIDPLLMVAKSKSYYRFLARYEKSFEGALTEDEQLVIEYFSRYIANGMRPHELLALQVLLDGRSVSKESLGRLLEYYAISLDDASYSSTVSLLNTSFVNAESERKAYGDFALVRFEGGQIVGDADLDIFLESDLFRAALQDVVDFGLRRFADRYAPWEGPFKRYEKYTRKDACRLLNWPQDNSSTMYGYRVKHGTCPIFVTYNKEDDISSSTQYEDAFIDQDTFSWMTRSRLTLDSPEVQRIIRSQEEGTDIHLFIKKSDGEGSDFYYMGKAAPVAWSQQTIFDDKGKELPIVNFRLHLEHSVRDDIYSYFVDGQPLSTAGVR